MEQITLQSLGDALRYWDALVPLRERWETEEVTQVQTGTATRSELAEQSILRDETFSTELDRYWQELKTKAAESKLLYMDWVGADTYEETVHRAYMTSFLITYGYATLEINPLEEEIFIMPLKEPSSKLSKQAVSVPISLTSEDWQKWKRGERE